MVWTTIIGIDGKPFATTAKGETLKSMICLNGTITHSGEFLCDWMMPDGMTCDAMLCHVHAKEVWRDTHLCKLHYHEWESLGRPKFWLV